MRVLIINGDVDSVEKMSSELQEHYIVDVAYNSEEGAFLSQVNEYDAVIIDSYLPDLECYEMCQLARESEVEAPILILLDNCDIDYKIASLDSGADAILTKPVDTREIRAHIRSLAKKNKKLKHSHLICIDDLKLDLKTKEVTRGNKEIILRRKEYDLLEYLMLNKNMIISKESLLEHVWESGLDIVSNTLEVNVKTLRDKIDRSYEHKLIKTVYGFGYKISF